MNEFIKNTVKFLLAKEKTDEMVKLITDANFRKNYIKSLADEIRDLYKMINRLEDRTRKKIKELDKDVQKISKYDTDSISDKQNSINTATELLKQINRLGKFKIGFDSTEIKIAKEYIKQKTRLFIATVKISSSISTSLIIFSFLIFIFDTAFFPVISTSIFSFS